MNDCPWTYHQETILILMLLPEMGPQLILLSVRGKGSDIISIGRLSIEGKTSVGIDGTIHLQEQKKLLVVSCICSNSDTGL